MRTILYPEGPPSWAPAEREDSMGALVLRNLIQASFQGELYPIHREAAEIQGLQAYPRSSTHRDRSTSRSSSCRPHAIECVEDCGRAGVKSLLVLSSGLAESGRREPGLQDRLRTTARGAGMRIVGPNSFGLINNDPGIRLNATLASIIPGTWATGPVRPERRPGGRGARSAARRGLGISVFASAGNRVDVSGNDLMQYWIDDQDTTTVGLYLESMGNPRKFSRIARHLASVKPVIVVSSGVSQYAAPPGHRTRTPNVPPQAFDALLRQAGVIRVENVHQLFDVAQLTLHQPMPTGDRVAVVGNSDALGSLSASAAESWGLRVTHGPVSLLPHASAEEFAHALDAAFSDPDVDSVVAAFIPPLVTPDEEVSHAVRERRGEA